MTEGADFLVLPYSPGTDTRLYFQPSLNLKTEHKWHIFEYSGSTFTQKRYFEELEEYIQLHCHEEILILVGHSASCRMSLEFLNKSLCFPDALAWISPVLEPSSVRSLLYKDLEQNVLLKSKIENWCSKLINKDCQDLTTQMITEGEFNETIFNEFENHLWQLSSAKISSAVTKIPIFGLCGGLDPLNTFEGLGMQLNEFHHKSITELTDIGHCPFIESPNVLSFLLEDFLQDLKSARSTRRRDNEFHQKKRLPDLE